MFPRGRRLIRPAATLAALCALISVAAADMVRRWRSVGPEDIMAIAAPAADRGDEPMARPAGDVAGGPGARPLPPLPMVAADPRMAPLRRAAESWRGPLAPRRRVVDQVCLVPDVPSFLQAIAAWDDRHYFPILIDEPAWTLPFLRAFRPARVLRYAAMAPRRDAAGPLDRWIAAAEAVARAWSPPARPGEELPPAGAPPRHLGQTPPGIVLSSPDSPMLAGAVALAAGRLEPLVRLEPSLWDLDGSGAGGSVRYADVLTTEQAWRFARYLERRVAGLLPRYDRLGDDCDFLTIAGDWPYRYDDTVEAGPARGIQALDDLIGRSLAGGPDAEGLAGSRRRWAFTGRLLGDPAASVARAMGALFLRPGPALLWDTYEPGSARSSYTPAPAAHLLRRAGSAGAVFFAAGPGADLSTWDRVMDPYNRFGLLWINSTGGPADFSIAGGPGRPADIPAGRPSAVVMIHSFSAADPADPGTIAGRWLTQGAFVYFGSVNEPWLQAFRLPGLVAELALRGVPLSAALRQGENEPLGRPWRLAFLGDPLFRIAAAGPSPGRLDPDSWREVAPEYAGWPAGEVPGPAVAEPPADGPADARLRWCLDAAVAEPATAPRLVATVASGAVGALSLPRPGPDWRAALLPIPRDRLAPRLLPAYDDLIVDVLGHAGAWDELASRFAGIPPGARRPRARAALEAGAMFRLARAAREPDPDRRRARIRDLQAEVARFAWPAGSAFPAQFAERAAREAGEKP